MLSKIIVASLFVYGVLSKSAFIGDVKRAELFELTDDEVAVFRITLPDDELLQLKEDIKKGGILPPPPPGMGDFGDMQFPNDTLDMPFPPPFPGMEADADGEFIPPPPPFDNEDSFKTKNATMTVEIKNKEKAFDKITFSLGGSSSRTFGKQGYNIKIRDDEDLYGRIHFRLRPDAREATFMRSKLVCDIHNRLGLPSISANYATLYINDVYMGFYVLLDALKLSWVEFEYDDKNSTTLYQCKNMNNNLTVKTSSTGCENENEEVTDHSEWNEFLTRLDEAQSAEDIEDIFDIDQFLTEIAYEYLAGSWDHYLKFGHNFYLYKPKNDKWKFMLYDFDGEMGQDVSMGAGGAPGQFQNTTSTNRSTDFPNYSFADWTNSRHLIDILILNNSTRFDNILRNFVTEVFNPTVLFPHIDELKEFIRPYVELDKTPDENGKYPGRLNEESGDYSFAEWEANSEFTKVKSSQGSQSYGLKYWILAKYRYVCKAYDIDCDPVYLDENYEIPVVKEVEAQGEMTFGPPPPPNMAKAQQPVNLGLAAPPTITITATATTDVPTITIEEVSVTETEVNATETEVNVTETEASATETEVNVTETEASATEASTTAEKASTTKKSNSTKKKSKTTTKKGNKAIKPSKKTKKIHKPKKSTKTKKINNKNKHKTSILKPKYQCWGEIIGRPCSHHAPVNHNHHKLQQIMKKLNKGNKKVAHKKNNSHKNKKSNSHKNKKDTHKNKKKYK